jgi:hypothetical protein
MRELHAGGGALRAHEARHPRQRRHVVVLPDPEIVRADAAARLDRGGLGHDQGGAADGAAAEVHEVPVAGVASSLEYWHIGDTPIRFRKVTSRNVSGSNSILATYHPGRN